MEITHTIKAIIILIETKEDITISINEKELFYSLLLFKNRSHLPVVPIILMGTGASNENEDWTKNYVVINYNYDDQTYQYILVSIHRFHRFTIIQHLVEKFQVVQYPVTQESETISEF